MSTTDTSPSDNGRGSDTWWLSWTHLSVDRRTPSYCRVTFDHPPINTITARTVAELAEVVGLIEHDPDLNVVVFDSANPDCYLGDYDTEHDPGWTAALGVGPSAMHAWLDLLVRLSRAPVVSIASIRGRVRGAGSEFVLACDLRFASRERALLGQFDGPGAEQRGYVNRVIADDRLDDEVESIASTLARLDHDEIARTKSYVDQVTLPADSGFPPALADLFGGPR
jgi:enoyl-CoA hydratase/carnithine racemase